MALELVGVRDARDARAHACIRALLVERFQNRPGLLLPVFGLQQVAEVPESRGRSSEYADRCVDGVGRAVGLAKCGDTSSGSRPSIRRYKACESRRISPPPKASFLGKSVANVQASSEYPKDSSDFTIAFFESASIACRLKTRAGRDASPSRYSANSSVTSAAAAPYALFDAIRQWPPCQIPKLLV